VPAPGPLGFFHHAVIPFDRMSEDCRAPGSMPTDLASLTRLSWCLGVRSRHALKALRSCSNPQLRTRLEHDLLRLRLQANAIARQGESMAELLGPLHWEVALLREVMRRNQRHFGVSSLS
jgi:hypothetical protein